MSKKLISLFLTVVMLTTGVFSCYADAEDNSAFLTEVFVRQQLFMQYALLYDTFNAAIMLEDGSEITGIGFTDYSSYFEAEDESVGYFSAGFIADYGYQIPNEEVENGLVIENLDFTDERYQFVYDYETVPFMGHCVKDGNYVKYGVNEKGAITYESSTYGRGNCDESLGALYSFDTGKYVYDPDMGNYIYISGISLFDQIDYAAIEAHMNKIIAEQNNNLSHTEIVSSAYFAQEAIVSYLLSMQEETFLGYRVSELVESASKLDPTQCIRITPEGFVTIDIDDDIPGTADELTKWLIGVGCFITVAGSIALNIFVPAARPLSGAITSAAIEVFIQVVINNKSLDNVKWEKVAVAAASGAMLAWLCPLGASSVTSAVTKAAGKEALGKLAGYGVLTLSNSLVSGITRYAMDSIDGKDTGWNTFWTGAAIGAASTILTSLFAEFVSPRITDALSKTKLGKWAEPFLEKTSRFIQKHQVNIKGHEGLQDILAPKSVHMAAKSAMEELNGQTGTLGGKYADLTTPGDNTQHKHEIPCSSAYNKANGIKQGYRHDLPAIKMSAEDHMRTASWGPSNDAIQYQAEQYGLISKGNITAAIQMDIDNIHQLFGSKYDEGIREALTYAIREGWWKPWTENSGILSQVLASVGLTLEEIVP